MELCKICRGDYNNDFVVVNEATVPYSGIEVAINKQGMLRVRYYDDTSILYKTQEVVNLICCPVCGQTYKPEKSME